MDWTNTGYSWDVTVMVIHQADVDNTLGFLSGVQLQGLTITENYYSDTRIQGKVTTIVPEGKSDGYVKNARLRIILNVPKFAFIEELMTGYVSDIKITNEDGYTKRQYTLESTIWGILEHKIKDPITIKKGAKLVSTWGSIINKLTKMQYSTTGAQDHAFKNNILYEVGTNLSTLLFELSSGYDRMGVDGHGRLTLKKYVNPTEQEPTSVMSYHDTRGMLVKPLARTSSEYDPPGRAIVTTTISKEVTEKGKKKTIQEVVSGFYDAPSSHATSINSRGWLRARSDSYTGASEKPSKSELNAAAKKNWEAAQDKGIEWTCPSVFQDWHIGAVITLIPNSTTSVKCLIKSVTTNLDDMTQNLTLKEV